MGVWEGEYAPGSGDAAPGASQRASRAAGACPRSGGRARRCGWIAAVALIAGLAAAAVAAAEDQVPAAAGGEAIVAPGEAPAPVKAPASEAEPASSAAPGAEPAPAAPPSPPGGNHGVSVRWSGSGELLFWDRISGSMRQPIFGRSDKNSTFKATHFHPKLTATLGPKALAYAEICITHPHVGTQAEQAWLEYDFSERANIQAGRILVPFGQWNQLHDVYDHKSISYPLMYLGHEEEELELRGGPSPIVSTGYSDIGVLFYGSIWPRRSDQLWYGAYVCNGRFGVNTIEWLDLWDQQEDNNSDKAIGGRLVYTRGGNLSIGASYQTGRFDPAGRLRYRFGGADLYYRFRNRVNFRVEYVRNPVDSLTQGFTKQGWWVQIDFPLGREMEFVATASGLGITPAQRVSQLRRYTVGVNRNLTRSLKLKTELEFLDIGRFVGNPQNTDDARFGTDFDDTLRFKSSLVAVF